LYRFDQPGAYSVRITARKGAEILYQSDWTAIEVQPFSEEKRAEWLASMAAKVKSGNPRDLASDVIPSLLAWPDEKALAILLTIIPDCTKGCVNQDFFGDIYGREALAAFDDALLRRVIPPARLLQLCPPDGKCK
jgi:hypothetical protein